MSLKHLPVAILLFLCWWHSHGQVIRFQAVGSGGTTPGVASNGTIRHIGVVGSAASGGYSNSGVLVAAVDYRPAHTSTAIAVTEFTINSISLEWTKGNGSARMVVCRQGSAVDAMPVDGTFYAADATFGEGAELSSGNFVVYNGGGNSVVVSGLLPDTEYHFRIFEYNGLYGDNPVNVVYQTALATGNPIVQTTFAEEPAAQPAALEFDNITTTSMDGSFTGSGAEGYLVLRRQEADPEEIPVDGVTYDGPSFGNSTVVHNGPSTSFTSADLVAGTVYHYKVFAYNGHGPSIRYRTVSPLSVQKITIPEAPPRPSHTDVATGSFRVNWTTVKGADGYEILVARNQSFTNIVPGYNPKYLPGGDQTQHLLEHLTTSSYYYRVRAVNASGPSDYSDFWNVFIAGVPGVNDLTITFTNNTKPSTLSDVLSVTISGGAGEKVVTAYYRPIKGDNFSEKPLQQVGSSNVYQATLDASVADDLGLEYYVEASDNTATISTSPGGTQYDYVYKRIPANTVIPNLPFGGTVSDYRMISIPYSLNVNSTAIVFSSLGTYDKTQWRLLNWNGTEYIDNPSIVAPGEAYWFNARKSVAIALGEGTVAKYNQSSPFQLSLRKGWNMISTPYPFAVSWPDILEYNNATGIGEYYTYNGSGYAATDLMEPWKGGFVFSESATTVAIPVTIGSSGGRKKNLDEFVGNGNWLMPLTAQQGHLSHTLAGIGMHADALESKDRFDLVSLPRFVEYVDLNSAHPEYFVPHFTRDIVPVADHYEWEFVVEGSGTQPVKISWESDHLQTADGHLFLYDRTAGRVINMQTSNHHTAKPGSILQFIFTRDERYPAHGLEATQKPFPNPFTSQVNLPSLINLERKPVSVRVKIYSMTGAVVYDRSWWDDNNIVEPVWTGVTQEGSPVANGVYYYELTYSGAGLRSVQQGKLIKQ